MTCQDTNNISIRFPRVGLEIRPYTVDFRINRQKFDFLKAKFSEEIGEYLKPLTQVEDAALRAPQPVKVVMDGEETHHLYFRPQYVSYGETNCWIEFHDAQKQLKYSVIDYKTENMTVTDIYRRVVDDALTSDVINGIEFDIGDDALTYVKKENPAPAGHPHPNPEKKDIFIRTWEALQPLWQDYDEEEDLTPKATILNNTFTFDLTNKSSLEALFHLNRKLGLSTWVESDGVLHIGRQGTNAQHHVASSLDSRVWRYSEAELVPPGQPIKMAVVNGGMIDAPNASDEEDNVESFLEFVGPTDSHEQDLIPQGVAQRPDVLDGKIVSVDEPNLSRGALESRAYQVLANEMSNNNSGSVEINPDTSGTEITDWRDVKVGDFLQLIPSEDDSCRSIERQVVLISGVKHEVDAGSWSIKLDIQKWFTPNTTTTMRYFSPSSDNYYDEDFNEIYSANDA